MPMLMETEEEGEVIIIVMVVVVALLVHRLGCYMLAFQNLRDRHLAVIHCR